MPEVKPNTSYSWNNDQKFELSGKEFETLLNTSRAVLSTPEAQMILFLQKANEIFESMFVKGVQEGTIVEVSSEPEVAPPAPPVVTMSKKKGAK